MTSLEMGDFVVPLNCASYSEIAARSWKTVGNIRAVAGSRFEMEKRTPLLDSSF